MQYCSGWKVGCLSSSPQRTVALVSDPNTKSGSKAHQHPELGVGVVRTYGAIIGVAWVAAGSILPRCQVVGNKCDWSFH